MTDLADPIERFKAALRRATDAGLRLPNGAALATVDSEGRPSVRVVLLKDVDQRGFVFYTNLDSRKSRELQSNPKASLCFWWPALEEQVRVEGAVELVDNAEADTYWQSRPRGSQLGAWASAQSEPLSSHQAIVDEYARLEKKYQGGSIPRPPFWSGFRVTPNRIEFWRGRDDRLHERELFTRAAGGWKISLLYP
jgi:pyridoxamine 5'-phosphate oxidase